MNDNQEDGIEYIWFFNEEDKDTRIKISRGEERIFIWCFFLALFEIEDFPEAHKDYIFIDDPVSSLDETNIFLTSIYDKFILLFFMPFFTKFLTETLVENNGYILSI